MDSETSIIDNTMNFEVSIIDRNDNAIDATEYVTTIELPVVKFDVDDLTLTGVGEFQPTCMKYDGSEELTQFIQDSIDNDTTFMVLISLKADDRLIRTYKFVDCVVPSKEIESDHRVVFRYPSLEYTDHHYTIQ